jgi:hypothetical protein
MDQPSAVPQKKHAAPKFVRWALMIGIVLLLNIFFLALGQTVLKAPQYADYCPTQPAPSPTDEKACTEQGGIWNPAPSSDMAAKAPAGYCDLFSKCQKTYDDAQKPYKLHAFELMLALGVLALIAGVLPLGSSIVSTGLSYGGVLAFLIASVQYWSEAPSWIRLLVAFIALAVLLVIGIKRFRD